MPTSSTRPQWGFQPLYRVGEYCSSSHHGGHTMECRNWVPLLWWLIHVDTQYDGRGLKMLNSQHVPLPFHFHSHQVMRKNIRLVNSRNLTGQDHNRILSQIGLPSSNQTWQWKLADLYRWFSYLNDHLKVIFHCHVWLPLGISDLIIVGNRSHHLRKYRFLFTLF